MLTHPLSHSSLQVHGTIIHVPAPPPPPPLAYYSPSGRMPRNGMDRTITLVAQAPEGSGLPTYIAQQFPNGAQMGVGALDSVF